MNNPITVLLFLLLLKKSGLQEAMVRYLPTLQLDAFIDDLHSAIHALEKMNQLRNSDLAATLPDMKKILEAVEKIPL